MDAYDMREGSLNAFLTLKDHEQEDLPAYPADRYFHLSNWRQELLWIYVYM